MKNPPKKPKKPYRFPNVFNAWKVSNYGPEKTQYLDIFHIVPNLLSVKVQQWFTACNTVLKFPGVEILWEFCVSSRKL